MASAFVQRLIEQLRGLRSAPETRALSIDGLEVELVRKRVRNVTLRIYPPDGRLRVTAPHRTPLGFIRDFVAGRRPWIERHRNRLAALPVPATLTPLTEADHARLAAAIAPLVSHWETALGVRVSAWVIQRMKTRWGSCNTASGRIWLNLELVRHPPECLDYVVLHEVAHLVERGHGERFKAVLAKHMPDWKARRARLRHGL